ncbi:Fic family protein [Methylobacillus flagellatus]|uniref:Fic family protein n=1 Tax=Methylobacillus flagellatus TaxID=405 RepID=UPI0028540B3D|nr:Fic family protein [Methylobacillus flagellatus]MDR5170695.1 Fic family protein [Methylobacillus flagellatus]
MAPQFVDHPLRIVAPGFDSPLTDVVIELDHLRRLQLAGDTPPAVFFQLKEIFHTLESLGSARIEGNHTTLADYIESKLEAPAQASEHIQEIKNIEEAMDYVERSIEARGRITEQFIRELHDLTVRGLKREGDNTPGQYRITNVQINGAEHLPPDAGLVPMYMQQLVDFINSDDPPKYDLLKMALAHHRFCWVHPFSNGNGRTVRLLSYAMLIKYGFNVQVGGRVLNPTAVFCNDRNAYYEMLSNADKGTDEALETWCLYVLGGIKDELQKVDQITQYDFLRDRILRPALSYSKERKLITDQEAAVISLAITHKIFKSADVDKVLPKLTARQRTYLISRLLERQMIRPIQEGGRTYTINFSNSYLLRGVVQALEVEGFIQPIIKAG